MEKSRVKEYERIISKQQTDYKIFCKKSRADQNKEISRFKDELKREEKSILKELKMNRLKRPKEIVKEEIRLKMLEIISKNQKSIANFEQDQLDIYEEGSLQLINNFKTDLLDFQLEYLNAKHNLIRAKEADIWEMEQSHMQIFHNIVKNNLSESFLMRRHQMHIRHQKDIEHHRQYDAQKLEIMRSRHLLARRRLPKQQRIILRRSIHDFKKQNIKNSSRRDDKEKIRQFEAEQLQIMRNERILLDKKLDRELTDFKHAADSSMIELVSLQNERKMHLTQQENDKLNEIDLNFQDELKSWRDRLSQRKETLETKCSQDNFDIKLYFQQTSSTELTKLQIAQGTSRAFNPKLFQISPTIPISNVDDS